MLSAYTPLNHGSILDPNMEYYTLEHPDTRFIPDYDYANPSEEPSAYADLPIGHPIMMPPHPGSLAPQPQNYDSETEFMRLGESP